jgi:plasmid stabilization system protein ParE
VVIEWSHQARTDIQDLKAYIAKDSPYYALRFTERIVASVERLTVFLRSAALSLRPKAVTTYAK